MPHLNLNWIGLTTPSMRTCCKAVSGECLCDALSWSALPTPSGRTGNTKTPDYRHPAAPGFTDTVCVRKILWGLGAIITAGIVPMHCNILALRMDGKNLHWRRMWKEVHILFQCCDRAWIARVGRGKIFETNIVTDYLWVNVIFAGLDPSLGRIRAARTPHSVPGITRCIISCKEVSAAAAAPFPSTFTNLIILAQGSSSKQAATPPQTFLHLGAELRSWQEKEWFLFACRGISELFSSNKNVSNWS